MMYEKIISRNFTGTYGNFINIFHSRNFLFEDFSRHGDTSQMKLLSWSYSTGFVDAFHYGKKANKKRKLIVVAYLLNFP